ncbi:hypothetical protein NOM01_16870 [Sporolactobacillus sp. STSJ-5]|uniref:hypothetical protein n=1 Tax=Sporolactobacillus sp. STSJ-5 TaxID=2965076 RepID=UPI00210825AA|nr:hypothetical protein [Sporolactobacillus sp. STSJ-5]MCQ2011656.1 hypothetical protein [Sporolactobacillus sp. STSJ-5]
MIHQQQKVVMLQQMIQEKINEREELKRNVKSIQTQIQQVEASINAFQSELQKFMGNSITFNAIPLKGMKIGEAAIQALQRLGGSAHYLEIKNEIEKSHIINGINEKSKADSVWNQLNKSNSVEKIGHGKFKLKQLR